LRLGSPVLTIAVIISGFGTIGLYEELIAGRQALENAADRAWTEPSKEAVLLDDVQRYVLLQKIGHGRHPERVRREALG
jgi:hypothetical protein